MLMDLGLSLSILNIFQEKLFVKKNPLKKAVKKSQKKVVKKIP